jgi:hypothetical protein
MLVEADVNEDEPPYTRVLTNSNPDTELERPGVWSVSLVMRSSGSYGPGRLVFAVDARVPWRSGAGSGWPVAARPGASDRAG